MDLLIETVSQERLAPFGQLLQTPVPLPRQDRAASIINSRKGVEINLALIRVEPFSFEPVTTMERHKYSTQLFAPLDVEAFLIVVAGGDAAPDLRTLRAFRVAGRQAINYLPGTWHIGMATLGEPGTFLMLNYEDGSAGDCEFVEVPPIWVKRPG